MVKFTIIQGGLAPDQPSLPNSSAIRLLTKNESATCRLVAGAGIQNVETPKIAAIEHSRYQFQPTNFARTLAIKAKMKKKPSPVRPGFVLPDGLSHYGLKKALLALDIEFSNMTLAEILEDCRTEIKNQLAPGPKNFMLNHFNHTMAALTHGIHISFDVLADRTVLMKFSPNSQRFFQLYPEFLKYHDELFDTVFESF